MAKKAKQPGKLELILMPIEDLQQDADNARTHNARNLEATENSIAEFDQQKPIVVDKNNVVIAGNGFLESAKNAGYTHLYVVKTKLKGRKRRRYAIADNRTSELADWDKAVLSEQLGELSAAGDDLTKLGFTFDELKELSVVEGTETTLEEPPMIPNAPKRATLGDLWQLGRHRVLCGDCCQSESWKRVLGGATPNLCVTDPPYGVDYDPEWRNEAAKVGNLAFGAKRTAYIACDDRVDWAEALKNFTGDVMYAWHGGLHAAETAKVLVDMGFDIRSQIMWRKVRFAISRGHYNWQHEPCWYAVRKGRTAGWIGANNISTVWDIGWDAVEEGAHAAQKPIECMAMSIRNHKGNVVDPFLGSGTTLLAAEQLERVCYGIEITPAFVDMVIARYETMTGEKAKVIGRVKPAPKKRSSAKKAATKKKRSSAKKKSKA